MLSMVTLKLASLIACSQLSMMSEGGGEGEDIT